jgi:uncharacterized membrane protein YgcG
MEWKMSFLHTMTGPDFLGLYFVWFLITWIGMLLVRHRVCDNWLTTLTGLALFEGLGVARYFVGTAHGMEKWDFMFIMMFVGALFFAIRAEHLKQGSNGGWSSCGGGGGCGGGGCGGGGCGGCGG